MVHWPTNRASSSIEIASRPLRWKWLNWATAPSTPMASRVRVVVVRHQAGGLRLLHQPGGVGDVDVAALPQHRGHAAGRCARPRAARRSGRAAAMNRTDASVPWRMRVSGSASGSIAAACARRSCWRIGAHQLGEQRLLVLEVPVEEALGHAGGLRRCRRCGSRRSRARRTATRPRRAAAACAPGPGRCAVARSVGHLPRALRVGGHVRACSRLSPPALDPTGQSRRSMPSIVAMTGAVGRPERAHRDAPAQPEVEERPAAHRDGRVHQLRRLPAALPDRSSAPSSTTAPTW